MKTSLEELRTISRNLAREGDFCRAEAIAEAADDLEALQAQLGHMGLQLTTLREELDSAHADHRATIAHCDKELARIAP